MAILTICPPAARLQWAFLTNAETDYDGHTRFRHRRRRWFDGHWMRDGRMKQAESESFPTDEPAVFRHKALLITVNRSATETSLYQAVRYAWRISKSHAKQAEVILATVHGLIVGAFVADDWLDATAVNFPGRDDAPIPGRAGFVGREAPDDIKALYVGKRVPEKYKSGAQNPIRYTWTA